MEFSVVIPTMHRPQLLKECIDLIINQTFLPKEIVVIDDGKLPDDYLLSLKTEIEKKNVGFQYFLKTIPGTATSRNKGIELSKSDVILFVDDDVFIKSNYIETLNSHWEKNIKDPYFAGVGGIIENLRPFSAFEKVYMNLFLLSSPNKWDITDVGYQVWDPNLKEAQKVYYLPGGISSFKKDFLKKIPYNQISPGRTPAEEVEIFIKAKMAGYYFILDPHAKVTHLETPMAREKEFSRGLKEGYNQSMIFRQVIAFSLFKFLKFVWCSIGWSLRQLFAGRLLRFSGMVLGYFKGIV
ncbi:MAG: glycosyltransferase family 2 protein [Elusimicrobiota bacterium]